MGPDPSGLNRRKPIDRVFHLNGNNRNALDWFWRSIRQRAGMPDVRLHDLRHSFASFAARRSETLPMIGKLLGHAKTASTARFVVSTHSSHIANEAGLETIRYFLSSEAPGAPAGVRQTKIKDLRTGLMGKSEAEKRFLHQYMTLTRCDLFFADKAILVEGLSERLMLPVVTRKLEEAEPEAPRLSSQYTSIIEVGGAYAHRFFDLLNFLELRSLIITDLDSTLVAGGAACPVHLGTATSNACIKSWFDDVPLTLATVAAKQDTDKCKGRSRLAYQCPEAPDGPCGRTFEDAFILANLAKFGIEGDDNGSLEIAAREKASEFKKSDFALTYSIEDTSWHAPRYMLDGVRWLAAEEPLIADPVLAVAMAAASVSEPDVAVTPDG